jgi:dynein light chain roadblock-type
MKSKLHEIMIAPDKDFLLIVVQGPKEDRKDDAE